MELKSDCLAAARRYEIDDLLRGIVDLDGRGNPDPSRDWDAGVSLVDITRLLQGGRSDAAVHEMTVHRRGAPAQRHVLKVGPLAEVAAEWHAYRTWLAGMASATVTPVVAVSRAVSEPVEPQRLGAIVYQHVATYAGRSSVPVSTLEDTVRAAVDGSMPLDDALGIVRTLFEQLDESVWKARSERHDHSLVGLNASLGPDLVLEVDRARSANTLTFQDPTDEQRRDKVRYSGSVLERASLAAPARSGPEALELGATLELRDLSTSAGPGGRLRGRFGHTIVEIRRADGADPHFQLLDYADRTNLTVVGRVVALRGLSWWAKIGRAVGAAGRDGDAIVIDGVPLGDPFAMLPARLTVVNERATTVVHGDLNPRNVLLVNRQIFLIDFAHTGTGPPLSDAAWLELCLLRDVVAPALGLPALVRLQRELALRTRVADTVTALPEPADRAAAVLWEIRAGAERCHRHRGTTQPWWREYQDQLLISALRTLKWDDPTAPQVYAALAAAGVAAEQLGPRPYRHWPADETLTAATTVLPVLAAEHTESLGIAAEFVAAVDRSGPTGERVVPFETALAVWGNAYVVAHHIESAAMVLAQLADDHDVFISLQSFIRLRGQLQGGGFGYWSGSPFAENPFDYRFGTDPFDHRSRPNPFDYSAPFDYSFPPDPFGPRDIALEYGDEAETEELEEDPHPAQAQPPWAAAELRDPDAIDLIIAEWAVVVLGDAGSGKSTVARELQYQLALAVMSAAGRAPTPTATDTAKSHRSMPQLLPITLRAPLLHRTLSRAPADSGRVDFAESLDRILRDSLKEPIPLELMRVGAVHLTIDAFNEVDPAGRERIADWIHWLRRAYARVPIVICHRRNGFNPNELPFPVVVLQSVSVEQARDYIRATLRLRKLPNHEAQAAALIRLLLDQPANPTIRDFARVPLYLWMITTRYAKHGIVPANVGELFAGFSQWYLTERDGDGRAPHQYDYHEQVRSLEIIARYLVENGNVTDITATGAAELLALAGLTDPDQRLDDLVAADMLDRDGAQLRFHHQSFQEYFAARVLSREVGDLAAFRDHVLEFRWREPLQMMLSFSGGDADLTRRLIDIALEADPRFAALLLRWTENPPREAVDRFLVAQRRTLATSNVGQFEWKRAADALVELGTDEARSVLTETLGEQSLTVQARSAALSALLSMQSSNRFEEVREVLTRDVAQAVMTILQSSNAAPLRTEAAVAAGSARLMPLAAFLVTLIDPDEAWPVVRAAWNSLGHLGQVVPPAMGRRYAAMCADRLTACRAELTTVSDRESIEELQDERSELIEVLADAGQVRPVLAYLFSYGLSDNVRRIGRLAPAIYAGISEQPLEEIGAGGRTEELLVAFRDGDEIEVAAAALMILAFTSQDEIDRMVASVSPSSSPIQLLAAAAAVDGGADWAPVMPILRDLIGRFPDERYLEATVALISALPSDEYECARLRLLAMLTFVSFDDGLNERLISRWPCIDLWFSWKQYDEDFASDLVLSDEEGMGLACYSLNSICWDDGRMPPAPVLTAQARDRLLTHLALIPDAELGVRGSLNIMATCVLEGQVQTLQPLIAVAQQSAVFANEITQVHPLYGAEQAPRGYSVFAQIGYLGRVAYDQDDHALAERAHSFLSAIGPQEHHAMERSRLIGLAILGDWTGLLTGLRPGDRRMLAAATNAIQVWFEGAPYTPAWAIDLGAIGLWIVRRLDDESLAPDVRSTLNEIKDWIEQQLGRNIAPSDAT